MIGLQYLVCGFFYLIGGASRRGDIHRTGQSGLDFMARDVYNQVLTRTAR